jgi:hypothetical protein
MDLLSLSGLSIPHLSVPELNNVSWLPSPLKLGLWGTGLVIAAGLTAFFLRSIRLALYLGLAGGLLLFSAAIATGYEKMGEDKIIPQVQELTGKLEQAYQRAAQFQADAVASQARATQAVRERNQALAKLKQTLEDQLRAQSDAVRSAVVDPAVRVFVNAAASSINGASSVAGAGADATATSATGAGDVTVGDWEVWSARVAALYGSCASQVRGLQDAYNGLVESSRLNDQLK